MVKELEIADLIASLDQPEWNRQAPPSTAEPIVLVCSADENYAMPMTVMAYSVLANLKDKQQKLMLYVLDGGIPPSTKQRVVQSLNFEQIEIHWVQPDRNLLQNLSLTRYLTIAAYYRLLMPEILPNHYDKAIYLDCDMIVRGDLSELWQADVEENYVLAVQDDNQSCVSMAVGLSNYKELGLDPDQKYFNSGLLVVNLRKWRDERIGRKILKYSRDNREYIRDADQDGLNAVFAGQWGQIDRRWNQMPRIYSYSSWQDSPYDETEYSILKNNPYIIHYTNAPKPWQHDCQHPAKDLFLYYLDQTAWAGWRDTAWRRVMTKSRKGVKKIGRLIGQLF